MQRKRESRKYKIIRIVAVILGVLCIFIGLYDSKEIEEVQELQEEVSVENIENIDYRLTLVNFEHAMDQVYEPSLQEVEYGYMFDERAVSDLKEMLQAGRDAGMNLWICSAYRSNNKQSQLFNTKVEDFMAKGYTYNQAVEETKKSIALPGTSEHSLGLAVDLVSKDYQLLDEQQSKTKEAIWLKEHCAEYGFILRYPVNKTDVTGVYYEPWHYRYVGKEIATEIMKDNSTLEEYLNK